MHQIKWILPLVLITFLLIPLRVITEDATAPEKNKGLSSQQKTEVTKLIKEYFESKDDAKKKEILAELTKYDDSVSKNDLASIAKTIWPLIKGNSKPDGKSPAKCTNPDYPGEYVISIPPAAKSGGKAGIFIGLHGLNCLGKDMQAIYGMPNPKLISVYPNTLDKNDNAAWKTEAGGRYVMAIIDDLKRTYNIDTNQIYMAGHSMGGAGTWAIGTLFADCFAGLSSMCGGMRTTGGSEAIPVFGTVANLKNTAIWFYHSTDDKAFSIESDQAANRALKKLVELYGPYDFIYKEYNAIGHGFPKEGFKPIWDWMFAKKRDPYPKSVIWEPTAEYKNHFYWLKVNEAKGNPRIEAKIEGNKISIKEQVHGLTIFLNEKLLDLAKPVIVEVAGKEQFNGLAGFSLSALVETIDDKKDPEMYFTSRIKIE